MCLNLLSFKVGKIIGMLKAEYIVYLCMYDVHKQELYLLELDSKSLKKVSQKL